MRLDAGEIAAEPLERRRRPRTGRRRRPSPRGTAHSGGFALDARAREAVGEDLVDDAVGVPGRAVVADGADEVVGVGDVVADEPVAGHPAVADRRRPRAASDTASPGSRTGKDARHHVSPSPSSSTSATATCGSPSATYRTATASTADARGTRSRTVVVPPSSAGVSRT